MRAAMGLWLPAQSLSSPGAASNRACSSGDWVFNMWQTSDQFPIPQLRLVSLLVTAEWLRSTLSIIQQTYQRVDQWELALSKPALAVCLKNAKVEDVALPLIRKHYSQRYSFLTPLSIWNLLLLTDIQELCIKWDPRSPPAAQWGTVGLELWCWSLAGGLQTLTFGFSLLFSPSWVQDCNLAIMAQHFCSLLCPQQLWLCPVCTNFLSLHCSLPICKSGCDGISSIHASCLTSQML